MGSGKFGGERESGEEVITRGNYHQVVSSLTSKLMVRVTFEMNNDDSWAIKTSNLKKLRLEIGEDIFDYFCCCFLHSDRITSLINFLKLSQEQIENAPIAAQRDRWTIFYFLIGEMKELERDLGRLRGELSKNGIWNKISWEQNLKKWEGWGQRPEISQLRNQSSFHVNKIRIKDGISSIRGKEVTIVHGKGGFNNNLIFEVAQDALIRGLQIKNEPNDHKRITPADILKELYDEDRKLFKISNGIQSEFLRVLKARGLEPIKIRIKK